MKRTPLASRTISRWLDHLVMGPQRIFFQNPKRILRNYIDPGVTVLDIGCGRGFFGLRMASMVGPGGRVVCVDSNVEAIECLKARAKRSGLSPRIDARACSERNLEIDDLAEQVDFALAFHVIHHAADVPALMTQVYAALRKEGAFLIVEPKHHASLTECEMTESRARSSGFLLLDRPRLFRSWAALLVKER